MAITMVPVTPETVPIAIAAFEHYDKGATPRGSISEIALLILRLVS